MNVLIGLFDLQLGNKEKISSFDKVKRGGSLVLFANISGSPPLWVLKKLNFLTPHGWEAM